MPEKQLRLPEVTDTQVSAVADAFGIRCDAQRQAILHHRDTTDIRACAGSGKTTLLVAKLALVLSSWTDRHRGLCILSHTNVAHEEIRRRFTVMPALRSLETYPHFLGTIQAFVNMSLGIPGAIEKYGVRPVVIDDDLFASRARRIFEGPSYAGARRWINNRPNGDKLVSGLRLVCNEQNDVEVDIERLPSPGGVTTQSLVRLKETLVGDGVFRYEDMDALGLWYAKRHPEHLAVIANRFPVVFVDEAQDTESRQAKLIDLVFKDRSVIQRFGDDRQAIYRGSGDEEADTTFPRAGYLSMTTSFRFSPSIARLAEHCCNGIVEQLSGNPQRPDHPHTVFLFPVDRIGHVLTQYAELVGVELGYGLPATQVMAVGFRRRGATDLAKTPVVLGDYWEPAGAVYRSSNRNVGSLEEFLAVARNDIACKSNAADARNTLLQAACRMLELQGVQYNGRPFSPARLTRCLQEKDHRHAPRLFISLGNALLQIRNGVAINTPAMATLLTQGLQPIHNTNWNEAVTAFIAGPQEDNGQPQAEPYREADSIFRFVTPQGTVNVGLDTIHSVKGKSLEAALVLTTYFRDHDLKALIEAGILCGRRPNATNARKKTLIESARRIHVAMTRPTRLLCLAIRDDHITANQRTEMEGLGWRFQTV